MTSSEEDDFDDLKRYFSKLEWIHLVKAEKVRYRSVRRNHLAMLAIGLNSPLPAFMRNGRPPILNTAPFYEPSDSEEEDEWTPHLERYPPAPWSRRSPNRRPAASLGGKSRKPAVSLGGKSRKPAVSQGGKSSKPAVSLGGKSRKPAVSLGGKSRKPAVSLGGKSRKPAVSQGGSTRRPTGFHGGPHLDNAATFTGQDDNAPIYGAQGVTEWFDEYEIDLNHMLWTKFQAPGF